MRTPEAHAAYMREYRKRPANAEKHRAWSKAWAANNREASRRIKDDWQRKRRAAHIKATSRMKRELGCAHCGTKRGRLDFHHVDKATKLFSITDGWIKVAEVLAAELAKCIVLCASCHTKHHHEIG